MIALILLLTLVVPTGDDLFSPPIVDAVKVARDRVFPTLVHIEPVSDTAMRGRKVETKTTGSGAIISPDGLVVTNFHVAGTAKRMTCTLSDRLRCSAVTVGADAATDLAVIRLDLDELGLERVPYASFGASNDLEVGDFVMAMGSPLGLTRSLSLGVVSCVDRHLEGLVLLGRLPTGHFNTWIQTDAAINPGNSGGPLVDLKGTVVGINARGYRNADNLGFAIPIDVVRDVVDRILRDGRVVRSQIGLTCQPLRTGEAGVLVASVDPASPAARAGIMAGDEIMEYAGVPVAAAFDEELPEVRRFMADVPAGRQVAVRVRRGSEEVSFDVTTHELEPPVSEDHELQTWGMTVRRLTGPERRELFLDDLEASVGVLVTGVRVGGRAAACQPPLARGDVIVRVAGQRVDSVEGFEQAMEHIAAAGGHVVMQFRRGGAAYLTAIPTNDSDEPSRAAKGGESW